MPLSDLLAAGDLSFPEYNFAMAGTSNVISLSLYLSLSLSCEEPAPRGHSGGAVRRRSARADSGWGDGWQDIQGAVTWSEINVFKGK